MVKLSYKLPSFFGEKGKNRKIEISEILKIIEDKTVYFNKLNK
jgi:hypothetical protein